MELAFYKVMNTLLNDDCFIKSKQLNEQYSFAYLNYQ